MKRNTKKRMMAMAMAALMVTSSFGANAGSLVWAAESSESITFPDIYTHDLVQPIEDEEVVNAKVAALVKTMTEDEKFIFLGGNGTGDSEGNAGFLKGVPRLGVPMIKMYDGPAGLLYPQDTTNMSQEQMLAATWDEEVARLYGETVSKENQAIGGAFMLSAQLDIMRQPQFQRTKDQMGEDAFLLSSMADDLVSGMQSSGGIAVLKHYAAFAENASPGTNTDVIVSEQALHETYLPGFESAVKEGNALGIMSAYNKVNGTFASANSYLQNDVLRDMWGYQYFTVTDWGGNKEFTLDKGTDIEMPSLSNNSKANVASQVSKGNMTQEEADALVDQALTRVLRAYGTAGYLTLVQVDENGYAMEEVGRAADDYILPADSAEGEVNETLAALYDESNAAVQKVAEEGGVLLKNENEALPLDVSDDKSVAVIGFTGMNLASGIGGERSYGSVKAMISPYEALVDILGEEKVEGQVYSDIIGTTIPNEYLYTSIDGEEHGATRTYGIKGSAGSGSVQQGQWQQQGNASETKMEGHEIGEYCTTDDVISFKTGERGAYTNDGNDGNALPRATKPAYTWETYVEAPETGTYTISFNSTGAKGSMTMYKVGEDGKETQVCSGSTAGVNQGTQYYSSISPTETGMNVSDASANLEAGVRYKVVIQVALALSHRDMQLELNWITPSQKQANLDNAIEAAKNNDTVVVFAYAKVSDPASTREATTLKLDAAQQKMILDVAAAAKENGNKVVVVLNNDSAVVMEDWINEVDAILEMYYPGQRGGVATANLLTGVVNPSGKLAFTIPKKDTDTIITISDEAFERFEKPDSSSSSGGGAMPFAIAEAAEEDDTEEPGGDNPGGGFPGGDFPGGGFPGGGFPGGGFPGMGGGSGETTYMDEGILTGYRWYDENDIEPEFDFGFGLSYTTFEYSDMAVTESLAEGELAGFDVTFNVTNTGDVAGSETAQVYIGKADVPEGVQSAEIQLVGFEKVKDIQPGETREVTIHVSERSLSYWYTDQEVLNYNADGTKDKWTIAEGTRTIYVGAASDNLIMQADVEVEKAEETIEIITQPVDVSVTTGNDASVYVEAIGKGLTYTWYYKNPGNVKFYVSGDTFADGNSYTIPMAAWRDGQQVYCEVTNADGQKVRSNTVTLSVKTETGITIITQPEDVCVANGVDAVATVEAEGEGLTYTWYYKNPGNVKFYESGAQFVKDGGASYSIPMAAWRDGQEVYCVITDASGDSVQTNTITLTMAE